jgi:AraC-like DNA-binding protein
MTGRYSEHPVPPRLAPYVECLWTLEADQPISDYPVLPDGCVDIVFSRGRNRQDAQVVGTMTHARKFAFSAGQFDCGVRFRPGMSYGFMRLPGTEIADRSLPLSEAWGTPGRELNSRLGDARSPIECIGMIADVLRILPEHGVVQSVATAIVARCGQVRVDELAFDAGMSARQLRRLFLEQIGLTPKHLSRVIRFRESVSRLGKTKRGDWTQVALDCGYYDQAHFINEFRELSGYRPAEFAARAR